MRRLHLFIKASKMFLKINQKKGLIVNLYWIIISSLNVMIPFSNVWDAARFYDLVTIYHPENGDVLISSPDF